MLQFIYIFTPHKLQQGRGWKLLEKSWSKTFADEIFPAINEERFFVLYSENGVARPNTPVNVIVGALIIKELFNYSDDEIVGNFLLDLHLLFSSPFLNLNKLGNIHILHHLIP